MVYSQVQVKRLIEGGEAKWAVIGLLVKHALVVCPILFVIGIKVPLIFGV